MEFKEATRRAIDEHIEALTDVSLRIHKEPELGHQEFKAASLLTEVLRGHGYKVKLGVADMKTAFIGRRARREGPTIGILAEYDTLPGIGHACATI